MKVIDIRKRMLLAALLPMFLIGLMQVGFFLMTRFDDLQIAYQQRTRSLAHQIALASEYGLFSANQTQLQLIANGALRESDVRWVAVLDNQGQILVSAGDDRSSGKLTFGPIEETRFDSERRLDLLTQPVFTKDIKLDDVYEDSPIVRSRTVQMGQVLLAVSRKSLDKRKQEMMSLGILIGIAGVLFGLMLALRLSRGVIQPIMRISEKIESIGRGDFSLATEDIGDVPENDPLSNLHTNLQKMARRLSSARDELEQQVSTATQALREKKEEAELANLAKSRFLAAASHDLRQPTHALGMFVARLAQLPHNDQTRQLIDNLEASVQAMQNLLDGLLDISRLDAHAVQVFQRPFALANLFDQLRQDMSQTALDKGLSLRIRTSPVWVMSDAALIYRILLNLVGNALRYTERGGVLVACRLIGGGQYARIEIWDTGVGIANEHKNDVFKEFFQVANAARDRNKGLGLGLNIVQRTCALLAHPLQVQSRFGIGSVFTVTLPCVAAVANQIAGSAQAQEPIVNDLQGMSVLVIEDDNLVRLALVDLLESWGMVVSSANGLSAAQCLLAEGFLPSLIISDYQLGETCNGIETIEQLRNGLSTFVPACLMSGDTDPSLIKAAHASGLTLLHKPVRPAKLRSLIRHLVNDHHSQSLA
jgi:signal transduction histidine kinase/CheY-like chemotaxis protein